MKNLSLSNKAIVLILVLAVGFSTASALSECTSISSSGSYSLDNDITCDNGTCFEINSDDVVMDCSTHEINNSDGDMAISVNGDNVELRNCNVKDFEGGVTISGRNFEMRDSYIASNYYYGLKLKGVNDSSFTNVTLFNNGYSEQGQFGEPFFYGDGMILDNSHNNTFKGLYSSNLNYELRTINSSSNSFDSYHITGWNQTGGSSEWIKIDISESGSLGGLGAYEHLHEDPPSGYAHTQVERGIDVWNVTGNPRINLTVYYIQSGLSYDDIILDEATMDIWHYHDGSWGAIGDEANIKDNYIKATNITKFSEFHLLGETGGSSGFSDVNVHVFLGCGDSRCTRDEVDMIRKDNVGYTVISGQLSNTDNEPFNGTLDGDSLSGNVYSNGSIIGTFNGTDFSGTVDFNSYEIEATTENGKDIEGYYAYETQEICPKDCASAGSSPGYEETEYVSPILTMPLPKLGELSDMEMLMLFSSFGFLVVIAAYVMRRRRR